MMDNADIYELTERELTLLEKHLRFYIDLASGRRTPRTADQRHFIAVTMGHEVAATEHERAFMKWRRLEASRRREEATQNGALDQVPAGMRTYPQSMAKKLDQAVDPGLSPRYRRR